jgi:putative copper export protein
MAQSEQGTSTALADDLFDKYALPKAALAVILVASLAGTAVSVRLAGAWSLVVVGATWIYLVALGVLTGGLLWKHGFVRPRDLEAGADEYCARMYDRFDRIAVPALVVAALSAGLVLGRYLGAGVDPLLVAGLGVAVLLLGAFGGAQAVRSPPVDAQFRHPFGVLALAAAVAAVALTATAEVALRSGGFADVGVRSLHLLAFAVWVGGAVWNIFVAVPTGQEHPTPPVVRAAGQQLERFRWAVRFVIATIALTGVYQAVAGLGVSAAVYVETLLGLVVLSKLGLVGVLFAIFKLCPMWRACSPIDGVCDLAAAEDSSSDGPEDAPSPTDD